MALDYCTGPAGIIKLVFDFQSADMRQAVVLGEEGKVNRYMYLERRRACVLVSTVGNDTLKTCASERMSRFGNYLSVWSVRVLVVDREQASCRNEGRRAFLLFLSLVLGPDEARSGGPTPTGRGETCSLGKPEGSRRAAGLGSLYYYPVSAGRGAVALCGEGSVR